MYRGEIPQGFAQEGRGMLTGGEDAVDVGDFQTSIPYGVVDRLQMERQLAFVRHGADLVALVHAHNADCDYAALSSLSSPG